MKKQRHERTYDQGEEGAGVCSQAPWVEIWNRTGSGEEAVEEIQQLKLVNNLKWKKNKKERKKWFLGGRKMHEHRELWNIIHKKWYQAF